MRFAKHNVELFWKALQALAAALALGLTAYTLLQVVPAYVKNYEFEDAARKEARLAVTNPKSGPAIQDDLYQKAQELGVPVEIGQIRVNSGAAVSSVSSLDTLMSSTAEGSTSAVGTVNIEVSYAVPVRFPGYTLQLRFHVHADDKSV